MKRKISVSRKRKLQLLEKEMQDFLKRVGYKGPPQEPVNEIPDYRVKQTSQTSDQIPGHGGRVRSNKYSGNEIAGLVTTHKSNIVPVRKDNPQAAVDAAHMRR